MTARFRFAKVAHWKHELPNIATKLQKRLHRAIAQFQSLPAQIVWGLTKSSVIDEQIFLPKYLQALKRHRAQLPTLGQGDAQIVETLEREGICITSLAALDLPETAPFWQAFQRMGQHLNQTVTHLKDVPHEIHSPPSHLMAEPELFRWGLNHRLLEIAETYLGLPIAYDGVSCFLSVPNGKEIGARAWHRDREDRRMLKVCVYLNDVDNTGGPFQCLPPDLNDQVCRSIKYRYKSVFHEEMTNFLQHTSGEALVNCIGSAGTVIFVDTARFYHRGKPPTQFPRTAVFFSYFSRTPWHPFFCQRTPLSTQQTQQLIQGLSQAQQACVNWHKALPLVSRLIPKSRI